MDIETIINQLEIAFKGRSKKPCDCIQYKTNEFFFIEDNQDKGVCVIKEELVTFEEEQVLFRINNFNKKNIAFWAIDGCFISSDKGTSHCDCIFFDNNDFCFAEFKFNATSTEPIIVKRNREKALNQLKSTYFLIQGKLSEHKFSLDNFSIEAFVCTPPKYPAKNTSMSSYAVEFLENYGIKLFEQNFKDFS